MKNDIGSDAKLSAKGTDAFLIVGVIIMMLGIVVESAADLQKNMAKKKNSGRFVDTGLFRLVRCLTP